MSTGGIARERLAGRVREALERGDLLLTAGAGFGKTTALEQALGQGRPQSAWVRCAAAHRDAGLLLTRIVDALAEAEPGATDALAERMAGAPERLESASVTEELISELRRLLIEPVALVFDDAERLDGAADSLRVLQRLLEADLPGLRVAVATRNPLELSLAKRRVDGNLTELGAEDLCFEAEECAALLLARTGLEPTDERVREVMEATEGWPLGVVLVAGQLERGSGVEPLGGLRSAPALRAYLSEELLASLDPDLRDAAIRSSAAERVTLAVARVLALPDGLVMRLERAGVPVRRSTEDDAFEYHPLLRDFLRELLGSALDGDALRALHAQLGQAATEDGQAIAALEHWLAAQAWTDAATAIEKEGLALVRTSPELVRAWIARLPPDVRGRPALRALEGHSGWLTGDNARAIPALRDAVRGFATTPDPLADWLARSILLDGLIVMGGEDEILPTIEGWDSPEAEGAFALAPAAAMLGAVALAGFARFIESDRIAAAALAHPESARLGPLEALRRFMIDLPAGRADEACARLEAEVRETEGFDPSRRRFIMLGALAVALGERGDLEQALRLWISSGERSRRAAPVHADTTLAWCASLHAEAGRLEEAEAALAQHRGLEMGSRAYNADTARAKVASLRGDAQATEAAASAALTRVRNGAIIFRYLVGVDLVPPLAAVGRLARAAELLSQTLALVDGAYVGDRGRLFRGRLLAQRAWLAHLEGDPVKADAVLIEAREAAGPAGRHVLRREWRRLEPVVWGALEREHVEAGAAVADIDGAFPGGLELVPFLEHPNPAVCAAALGPAVRSGDPRALALLDATQASDPEQTPTVARVLPPLRLSVLGRFGIARGAWTAADSDWGRPVDARLVRYLLTRLDTPVPEDLIFDALWPELEPRSARRSLHVAVSRTRKLLDLPRAQRSTIEGHDHAYRLALGERDGVDAEEFRAAAVGALGSRGADRQARLERARTLWTGEPLTEERYSDWAAGYREELGDLYVAVLTALVELYGRSGDHVSTAGVARTLVEADPLNEGAHRALITAHARAGRTGHALRQYLECRRTLVDELGIEPSEATSQLQARILAGKAV